MKLKINSREYGIHKHTGWLRKLLRKRPSPPVPFGYKISWIVVPASDPELVAKALQLTKTARVDWRAGIEAAYNYAANQVFIAPPIKGWIAVIGYWAGGATQESAQEIAPVITHLSSIFGQAQGFATHRIVEYHHWIKARDGKLVRAYAYLGEQGEVQMDEGDPTDIEQTIMLRQDAEMPEWWPDEADVMKIAAVWSFDPTELSETLSLPAYGLLASAPKP